jgi:hypothetical protein
MTDAQRAPLMVADSGTRDRWVWIRSSTEWLVLAGWVGSWGFFALGVAPTAFRVLPSSLEAGELVAPLLRGLHWYGLVAGTFLAISAWWSGRSHFERWLPVALALLCAITEFGVSAAIARVRPHAFGAVANADAAARFAFLHTSSRALFASILTGAAALLIARSRPTRS